MNPANDIRKQAHQGSVAAIIQVLNQELSDLGVRTRAVFDGGVLQLLCEADTPGQLSQDTLPDRVKSILESLAPRSVRRVNINSRIVLEQQLLWLDEIHRGPEKLLWSKEIKLTGPNFVKTIFEDVQASLTPNPDAILGLSPRQEREKRQFWRGILGGVGATIALLLGGWVIYQVIQGQSNTTSTGNLQPSPNNSSGSSSGSSSGNVTTASIAPTANNASISPEATPQSTPQSTPQPTTAPQSASLKTTPSTSDSFVIAVRLAEEAAAEGTKAQTSDDWRSIAEKWGKASELMAQVPPADKNYTIAQDRTTRYKSNQASALTKVK